MLITINTNYLTYDTSKGIQRDICLVSVSYPLIMIQLLLVTLRLLHWYLNYLVWQERYLHCLQTFYTKSQSFLLYHPPIQRTHYYLIQSMSGSLEKPALLLRFFIILGNVLPLFIDLL